MINPWSEIVENENTYVLASDRPAIESFNKRNGMNPELKIHSDLLPEPFIGDKDAPIVLLNLNPGYSMADYEFYSSPERKQIWSNNIQHYKNKYPFFMIDPVFNKLRNGYDWWSSKLKDLIFIYGAKKLSQYLLCIEFFPYHSKRYKNIGEKLHSQLYSFQLVQDAIKRGAIIIVMRSRKFWFDNISVLSNYKNLYFLNSTQNIVITKNNCPLGYPVINKFLDSASD